MPWITRDPDESELLRKLSKLPGRIVGLMAPVLIDRRLEIAIRKRWRDTAKHDLLDDLFRDGGALGSFKTRIQIAFAIELIDELAYADLLIINKIRNAFAHQLSAKDFDSQRIKALAANLKLPARYPGRQANSMRVPRRTVQADFKKFLLLATGLDNLEGPRNVFLRATEIAVTLLWIQIDIPGRLLPRKPAQT